MNNQFDNILQDKDVFISHSSHDNEIAEELYEYLKSQGIKPWMDLHDIMPGMPYARAIIKGIESCKVMVVILSKEANTSENITNEIDNAHRLKKVIFPFLTDESELSLELQYYLSRRQWIKAFSNSEHYFPILLSSIKSSLNFRVNNTRTSIEPRHTIITTKHEDTKYKRINMPNGYFCGNVVEGHPQGIGALFFDNGQYFEGEFKNGVINGSGMYYWNENHFFAGSWENGVRNGYGIEVSNDKIKIWYYIDERPYERRPKPMRENRLDFSNGYYIGETSNGRANGYGKYYWEDGSCFDGVWSNGVINGNGLLAFPNDKGFFVGQWNEGRRKACYGLEVIKGEHILIGFWKDETYLANRLITAEKE